MKIYINENQLYNLKESSWNYHFGKNHDGQPYKSENKYLCYHDTGQFGSGTYFSTYRHSDTDLSSPNDNPQFIQIRDGLYRVDFDLYENLYRVYNERQGDTLHTMLSDLNAFYHKISGCDLGKNNPKNAQFNNSWLYQRIKVNSNSLGLSCPSYLKLIRMAQKHAESDKPQSFSTLFMELNGYNGVNVSGVDKYDNSTHGSVIYDLSKTESIVPLNKTRSPLLTVGSGYKNTIANDDWKDSAYAESLAGKWKPLFLDSMDDSKKLRMVKNLANRGYGFTAEDLKYHIEKIPHALPYVLRKMLNHTIDDEATLDRNMQNYIADKKIYQFIDFLPKNDKYYDKSYLIKFLNDASWEIDDDDINGRQKMFQTIMSYLHRPLTDIEKQYIQEEWGDCI